MVGLRVVGDEIGEVNGNKILYGFVFMVREFCKWVISEREYFSSYVVF